MYKTFHITLYMYYKPCFGDAIGRTQRLCGLKSSRSFEICQKTAKLPFKISKKIWGRRIKYLRASAIQTQFMGFGVDLVTIS